MPRNIKAEKMQKEKGGSFYMYSTFFLRKYKFFTVLFCRCFQIKQCQKNREKACGKLCDKQRYKHFRGGCSAEGQVIAQHIGGRGDKSSVDKFSSFIHIFQHHKCGNGIGKDGDKPCNGILRNACTTNELPTWSSS